MVGAYVGMIFSVLVWGSNFIAGDWLVAHLNPVLLAMTRLLFSSTFLIIAGFALHKFAKPTRKQLLLLLLSGFLGTLINQTCFFSAVRYIPPTQSALIMSLAPVATALFAFLFLREKLTLPIAIGSGIAIFGVVLLVLHGNHLAFNIGDLFALGAMITFSCNMVIVRLLSKGLDAITITIYATLMGTGLFVPTSIGTNGLPHYPHTGIFWTVCVLSAIFSQGICSLLMNRAVTKIGATQVAVVSNLQPFISMVVGYFALHIPITSIQVIGGIVIVVGVLFATIRVKKRTAKPQQPVPASV